MNQIEALQPGLLMQGFRKWLLPVTFSVVAALSIHGMIKYSFTFVETMDVVENVTEVLRWGGIDARTAVGVYATQLTHVGGGVAAERALIALDHAGDSETRNKFFLKFFSILSKNEAQGLRNVYENQSLAPSLKESLSATERSYVETCFSELRHPRYYLVKEALFGMRSPICDKPA